MIRVSMREAKTGLPDLAERARAGERVVIERDGTPWVELKPYAGERRRPGGYEGQIAIPDVGVEDETIADLFEGR
ncbi:antitoxin (DNA-binding transcriptional repressor) of toxin-antitoxin stability system [Inquilinus ginsengisoli]|uniref:type II toxin-antitoxin system Phd/YefM family antitoxin n=1 Tax=Inquilinus ginsengisoli TaxID=363840 RepID=UPI003D1C7947